MVGIGEKIKDAVTGHHDTTATNNKNDSLACEDRGAQHHTGHAHHDPEADAKKATSAAGNYPYWGNVDREGQGHRSEGLGSGSRETQQQGHGNTSGIGSGAGAGVAGAGYLASRDRDDHMGHQATSSVPGTHTGGTTAASSGRHHDPERDAQHATSAAGNYPNNTNDHDSRREKEYLGAGAGAAGLAGAGYLASRDRNEGHQSSNAPGPNQRNVAFSGNNAAPGTTQTGSGLQSSGQHHRDPELDAQKATSAAGNYPHLGEQGDHSRNRDERNLGAGAAGLTGAAGAGYLGHQKLGGRNDAQQSYPSREANTGHSAVPSSFDQLESNSRRSADPYGAGTSSSTGGHHDSHGNRRGEEGLVGAAGLGAAGYAANERHRQHNDTTRGDTGFNNEGYNSNDTTPAQVAAQKAWAQENSATSGSFQEPGANYSRSDNNNNNMRSDNNNLRSDAEYAAAGTAAGAGATGLAHRQHGHGQTGTEDPSRTHAHRGSDTTDYAAQNSQSGARRSSRAGSTGESGDQPRVVHKCTKCGHDNVISHYAPLFRKDATARTVQ